MRVAVIGQKNCMASLYPTNTTKHTSTGFLPAFLLRGFHPQTPNTLQMRVSDSNLIGRKLHNQDREILDPDTPEFIEDFTYFRNIAKDALKLAQAYQERYYNEGRLMQEFEVGDYVLLNLHSLRLLRNLKGRGRKFAPRFEGPYEIISKISLLAYRLRLPASYQGHPVINIAHLEPYHFPTDPDHNRPKMRNMRKTFEELEEFEVERIVDDRLVRGPKGRRIRQYKVRWKGYAPKYDTWEVKRHLKNAPAALREYEEEHSPRSQGTAQNDI